MLVGLCTARQAVQTQQTLENVAVSAAVGKAVIRAGLSQFSKHSSLLVVQTGLQPLGYWLWLFPSSLCESFSLINTKARNLFKMLAVSDSVLNSTLVLSLESLVLPCTSNPTKCSGSCNYTCIKWCLCHAPSSLACS